MPASRRSPRRRWSTSTPNRRIRLGLALVAEPRGGANRCRPTGAVRRRPEEARRPFEASGVARPVEDRADPSARFRTPFSRVPSNRLGLFVKPLSPRERDDDKVGSDKDRGAGERSVAVQCSRVHVGGTDRISDRDTGSGIAGSGRCRRPAVDARPRGRTRGGDPTAPQAANTWSVASIPTVAKAKRG
jgi:hypothetical protein